MSVTAPAAAAPSAATPLTPEQAARAATCYRLALRLANRSARAVAEATGLAAPDVADDLVEFAWQGLLRAARKWTPDRGAFTTLAWWCVARDLHGARARFLRRHGREFPVGAGNDPEAGFAAGAGPRTGRAPGVAALAALLHAGGREPDPADAAAARLDRAAGTAVFDTPRWRRVLRHLTPLQRRAVRAWAGGASFEAVGGGAEGDEAAWWRGKQRFYAAVVRLRGVMGGEWREGLG